MMLSLPRNLPSLNLSRGAPHGGGLAEAVVALPLLLILGLGLLQVFLIFLKAILLQYSVSGSARAIAVSELGDGPIGIEVILSQQMVPSYLKMADLQSGLPQFVVPPGAMQRFAVDRATGYLDWKVVNPTRASFSDWHAEAVDVFRPITPGHGNDRISPRSGVASLISSLPVGKLSGQTLLDASTLKLQVTQGIPLDIPLVGRLIAGSMSRLNGCPSLGELERIGAVKLGATPMPFGRSQASMTDCLMLVRSIAEGRPRIPMTVIGMALLQHPVRSSALGL